MKKRMLALCCCLILCCAAFPTAAFAASPVQKIKRLETWIDEARAQYLAEDHTPLSSPVPYKILWIGYTHVTYEGLDFRMNEEDRDYLRAVTRNFEAYVEYTTSGCLDVQIDLYFVDAEMPLTKVDGDDWLMLTRDTVRAQIDFFDALKEGGYDTVLTTVQTDGDDNVRRNQNVPGYGRHYVMLGVMTHGLRDDIGYSSFVLGTPRSGTYPQSDPRIPSLYATAVAVHEWLHQLEYLGEFLGIEYPDTHVYQGGYEGYQTYTADLNNYDYFEFYELVLRGMVPYTGGGSVKRVGMYPAMWRLVKRNALNLGKYIITNAAGEYMAVPSGSNRITVSNSLFRWVLRYAGNGRVILSPQTNPDLRIDLDNAWDAENNTVKVWNWTGYDDAQTWHLTENADGSFCIQTVYSSGRVVTVPGAGQDARITTVQNAKPDAGQRWYFNEIQ